MVDPIDDIARQARQGSVAAIIQILNEKLADSGVRTRAIFEAGVLQLLCEAPLPEQLEQTMLIDRVRSILESISPQNIRRVNINSRIVREQQLLWLEEINRDPESQLLWSKEITLARPNFLKRWLIDQRVRRADASKSNLPQALSSRQLRERQQFWRGLLGGSALSLLLLVLAWMAWNRFGSSFSSSSASPPASPNAPVPSSPTSATQRPVTPATPVAPVAQSPSPAPAGDPFVEAVRIAEKTSAEGKTANSSAEWLTLAGRWQKASDLMSQVQPQDQRYKTAQDRVEQYRNNSQAALQRAQEQQTESAN